MHSFAAAFGRRHAHPAARVCLAVALWMAHAVFGADLQVSPVSLHFGGADQAQGLWIANAGQEKVHVQVRIQEWTQPDTEDVLAPTRELVASPPLAAILPGERQLVRIVRPVVAGSPRERSYRVIIDELPVAGAAAPAAPQGLRLLLRHSLPAFIAPSGAEASLPSPTDVGALKVHWDGAGGGRLRIDNGGLRRVRISQLAHEDDSGHRTVLVPGLLGYVLGGSSMAWELPGARPLRPGKLRARLNDDPLEQDLPLASRRL